MEIEVKFFKSREIGNEGVSNQRDPKPAHTAKVLNRTLQKEKTIILFKKNNQKRTETHE